LNGTKRVGQLVVTEGESNAPGTRLEHWYLYTDVVEGQDRFVRPSKDDSNVTMTFRYDGPIPTGFNGSNYEVKEVLGTPVPHEYVIARCESGKR
jgi:hypothetical protein